MKIISYTKIDDLDKLIYEFARKMTKEEKFTYIHAVKDYRKLWDFICENMHVSEFIQYLNTHWPIKKFDHTSYNLRVTYQYIRFVRHCLNMCKNNDKVLWNKHFWKFSHYLRINGYTELEKNVLCIGLPIFDS
tara:strand:+ start:494 stop:892 length:399 start_codon:yes stop_codon:yes gene_type:complete